jgi:hypothetical protein
MKRGGLSSRNRRRISYSFDGISNLNTPKDSIAARALLHEKTLVDYLMAVRKVNTRNYNKLSPERLEELALINSMFGSKEEGGGAKKHKTPPVELKLPLNILDSVKLRKILQGNSDAVRKKPENTPTRQKLKDMMLDSSSGSVLPEIFGEQNLQRLNSQGEIMNPCSFSTAKQLADFLNAFPGNTWQVMNALRSNPEMVIELSRQENISKENKKILATLQRNVLVTEKAQILRGLAKNNDLISFNDAVRHLSNSRAELRSAAVSSLAYLIAEGKFSSFKSTAINLLVKRYSQERSAYVRANIIFGLTKINEVGGIRTLISAAMKDSSNYVQTQAIGGLLAVFPKVKDVVGISEQIVRVFWDKLKSQHRDVRGNALLALAEISPQSSIVTAEKWLYDSKSEITRQYGVRALTKILEVKPELRGKIKKVVEDAVEDVKSKDLVWGLHVSFRRGWGLKPSGRMAYYLEELAKLAGKVNVNFSMPSTDSLE